MLKIGDTVKVVADKEQLSERGVATAAIEIDITGQTGEIVDIVDEGFTYRVKIDPSVLLVQSVPHIWYLKKEDIEPVRSFVEHPDGKLEIRKFESGATRDTAEGKLDYVKALCPLVLKRYVQYLDKHRKMPDGSMRDFDNWKQGIDEAVYHSSSGRHFFDTWLLTEGFTAEDNHGPVELEDALCAQLFNIMGRLHEILVEKED